jgi:hypothetical protein
MAVESLLSKSCSFASLSACVIILVSCIRMRQIGLHAVLENTQYLPSIFWRDCSLYVHRGCRMHLGQGRTLNKLLNLRGRYAVLGAWVKLRSGQMFPRSIH